MKRFLIFPSKVPIFGRSIKIINMFIEINECFPIGISFKRLISMTITFNCTNKTWDTYTKQISQSHFLTLKIMTILMLKCSVVGVRFSMSITDNKATECDGSFSAYAFSKIPVKHDLTINAKKGIGHVFLLNLR